MKLRDILHFALFFVTFAFLFPTHSIAKSHSLITLSPAIIDLDGSSIQPGGYPISIHNSSNSYLQAKIRFVTFSQDQDQKIMFDTGRKSVLADFLFPSEQYLQINPRSTRIINLVPSAELEFLSGDYYESIFFDISPVSTSENIENSSTNISTSITSLILFRNSHNSQVSYIIDPVQLSNWVVFVPPVEVEFNITNSGNSYTIPRGTVKLVDNIGRLISQGSLNSDSIRILPKKSRKVATKLNKAEVWFPVSIVNMSTTIRDSNEDRGSEYFIQRFLFVDPILMVMIVFAVLLVVLWQIYNRKNSKRLQT